jgi:hypothetical protein
MPNDLEKRDLGRHVRRTLRQFVSDPLKRRAGRNALIRRLTGLGGEFVIFGGVLRDLLHRRTGYFDVHDVDIVYDGIDEKELIGALGEFNARKNRFGGWKLDVDGNAFDIWRLQDTWAFQSFPHLLSSGKLGDLVFTTQLSVEAIVVYMKHSSRRGREVVTAPIFDESVSQRCVELNFEPNPNPAASVVRAIVTANRLRYQVGPQLARYISAVSAEVDSSEFANYLHNRYPGEMSGAGLLTRLDIVRQHVTEGRTGPLQLPFAGQELLFDLRSHAEAFVSE